MKHDHNIQWEAAIQLPPTIADFKTCDFGEIRVERNEKVNPAA